MKKYVYSYTTSTVEFKDTNIINLCDKINDYEKLDKKINKWNIFNYYQNKTKNPNPILLNINRKQL